MMQQHAAAETALANVFELAAAVGRVAGFVDRGGTAAMVVTCDRLRELVGRLERFLRARHAAPAPPPEPLAQCLGLLPELVEVLGDVRAMCEKLYERGALREVAGMAEVFASIDQALDGLDRELPHVDN